MRGIESTFRQVVLLSACAATALAHGSPQQTFRAETEAVSIAATVVDDEGRPVGDLVSTDFAVRVDGKPRAIAFATFVEGLPGNEVGVTPRGSHAWSSNRSTPGSRRVLVVLDRGGLPAATIGPSLKAAAAFVRGLGTEDRAGLVGIPGGNPLVDLSREKERVAAALERPLAPAAELASRRRLGTAEALAIARHDDSALAAAIERECNVIVDAPTARRMAERGPGSETSAPEAARISSADAHCAEEVLAEAAQTERGERERAFDVIRSLRVLVEGLGGSETPTRVLVVSAGFAWTPEVEDELGHLARAAAAARVTIDAVQPSGPAFDLGARRAAPDWSADAGVLAEGLGRVSERTGGLVVRALLDPAAAFARLQRESAGHYLLALEPRGSDRDGKLHAVEVRVLRPRVTVRARRQFVIDSERPARGRAAAEAMLRLPLGADEIPMEAGAYVLHGEGDRLTVIAAVAAGTVSPASAVDLSFALVDERGTTVAAGGTSLESGGPGTPAEGTLSLGVPPGSYSLRLAVADEQGRRGGLAHPIDAHLGEAGGMRLSDLVIGDPTAPRGRRLRPCPSTGGDQVAALVEIDSADPDLAVDFEVAPSEGGPPVVHATARTRREGQRVTADATLSLSGLDGGDYVLRAVARQGSGTARLSRAFVHRPAKRETSAPPDAVAGGAPEPVEDPSPATGGADAIEGLLRKAGERIRALEGRLAVTMGREEYSQAVRARGYPRLYRRTVSDVAWVPTTGAMVWTFFRDVVSVDGKTVPDRQGRLEALFAAGATAGAREKAEALLRESARHNIGRLRTVNTPTLGLSILHPWNQDRFRFTAAGTEKIGATLAARVRFEEVARPTLATSNGRDLPVRGTLFLDRAEGALVASEVRFSVDGWPVRIKVSYERQGEGSVWLPIEMKETYGTNSSLEQIDAQARYSGYRSAHVEVEGVRVAP